MRPVHVTLVVALATLACSDPPADDQDPPPADTIYVWRVERGDVGTRAFALAGRLGLDEISTEGTLIRASGAAGVLETDYASGRMRFSAAMPIPLGGGAAATDDAAIILAATELHRLELLPAEAAPCACAAGLEAGCPAPAPGPTPWRQCDHLAVRIFGLASDLVPPPSPEEQAEIAVTPVAEMDPAPIDPEELSPDTADPPSVPMPGEPIEVAFTPRLPARTVDGVTTYAELVGGMADLVVRLDPAGELLGFDSRYQPVAAEPIATAARELDEIFAEKNTYATLTGGEAASYDPAAWTLTYLARPLMTPPHHGPTGTTPLRFYYPMWARLTEGSNLPVDLGVATTFLPRITALDVPENLDEHAPERPIIRLAADTGTGTPVVTWSVRNADGEQVTLERTPAVADPEHAGEWRATLDVLPPEGAQNLTLEIEDDAGLHYEVPNVSTTVLRSNTDVRALGAIRTSHNQGRWGPCPGAPATSFTWCHTDGTKVVLVSRPGKAKSGPWGVRVLLNRDTNIAPAWSTQFIRDLVLYQFHLDMKLKIPERKRDPVKGWAEDWPLAGDPDVQTAPDGSKFKEIWIRTDTCKLDSDSAYICEVVPNGPAPLNPNRKMGVLCPKDRGHPLEAGTDPGSDCTIPERVNNGFEIRRIVTGMPGRLTLTQRFVVDHETVPVGISDWALGALDGTVLRLVRANTTQFDAVTTNRMVTMLQRMATPNPAVTPQLTWKWEGDRPRARPEDAKIYGGTSVECLNVLEFCRQANIYDDPRRYPWDFGGARIRPRYLEASTEKMPRPWERGMPAGATALRAVDRNEGDPYPYCPHELYRVLKERFCPCRDDGSPCQATGDPTRPNPPIEVTEIRLGAYMRMTPFENGNGGATLIAELKGMPEQLMGLEGHSGAKMHSAIPRAIFLNNVEQRVKKMAFWAGLLFPVVKAARYAAFLAGFLTVTEIGIDAFNDWMDVMHWYEQMQTMPIVRPTSRIPALGGVVGTRNSFYWLPLGTWPNYTYPGPERTFSWGDKTSFPRLFPQPEFLVPPAFNYQGFWQNLHFKSTSDTGTSNFTQIVVPGCQSLFPIRRVIPATGQWFWTWDRNLCVHHHETWFHLEPQQRSNHDIAWMLGVMRAGTNPTRVGDVVPDTVLMRKTGPNSATLSRIRYWEFTVTRTLNNTAVQTFHTPYFFSQGPDSW